MRIVGIEVDILKRDQLHSGISKAIEERRQRLFFHVNARLIALAETTHPELKPLMASGDVSAFCDGSIVQVYASLAREPVPEKLGFNIWLWDFFEFAQEQELRVFFLGSAPEVLVKLEKVLSVAYPSLTVGGSHHGYFDHDDPAAIDEVIRQVNDARPDVLFVAFGMPSQELWIARYADQVDAMAILPCGGAFDFVSGSVPVAPRWVRRIGMEWLFRSLCEPRRLLARNLQDVSRAALVLTRDLVRTRWRM